MGYKLEAERLAYWYLRLNGFLTIENFILHDEKGCSQRTDLDLLALRFPHRREALRKYTGRCGWMKDDPYFAKKEVPFGVFVEVKTGQCALNGPWTDRTKCNMPRALRALGATPESEIQRASTSLYQTGLFKSDSMELGLISIGDKINPDLQKKMPMVLQITWGHIKDFIFNRFTKYEKIKREHPQWDLDGHLLWKAFKNSRGEKNNFASSLVLVTNRPTSAEIDGYCRTKIYRLPTRR